AEADLMRRVLPKSEYAAWLTKFLPSINVQPEVVTDPSDPKLAHLDGLNLSRAWMLEGIASGLPASDPRVKTIRTIAAKHRQAGLAAVTGEHYEGGHWLLARLARTLPDAPFAAPAVAALKQTITPGNIAQEVEYLRGAGRASFERPYGLAWLLQLGAELRESEPALARTLQPLEAAASDRLKTWLPKLSHPIRIGEHSQSAFAFGLILDSTDDPQLTKLVRDRSREFFLKDRNCPLAYEPSGEDFLSPCIAEADLMRRVLPKSEYAAWLTKFLPSINVQPEVVTDPSDPKLAHLDGLNLSRAWMLEGIASGLPASDPRVKTIRAIAVKHRQAGLAAVTGEHYEGGHWLGSFAVYLTTGRGLR
ncbi:MAG: DUF2891 family protein, partial [Thermoanaerobaculia bacterium]